MDTNTFSFVHGAVPSQTWQEDSSPCGLMLKSITLAEWNYDIGDEETLGIVKPLFESTNKHIRIQSTGIEALIYPGSGHIISQAHDLL